MAFESLSIGPLAGHADLFVPVLRLFVQILLKQVGLLEMASYLTCQSS